MLSYYFRLDRGRILAADVRNGLIVDIRNVSNRVAQFNANLEPILASGIVPIPAN